MTKRLQGLGIGAVQPQAGVQLACLLQDFFDRQLDAADVQGDAVGHQLLVHLAKRIDAAYLDHRVVSDRTVDSHIKNLRRKIVDAGGRDPIVSVYGVGYKLDWDAEG